MASRRIFLITAFAIAANVKAPARQGEALPRPVPPVTEPVRCAVFSAWAANAVPVAEYTLAQIILANKGFFHLTYKQGTGDWKRSHGDGCYTGNYETKVGIIGAGMIGKLVIGKLKALDKIDVLVFDPFLPDEKAAELGVTKVDLHTLFAECAIISNHLANNEQTKGMLTGAHFASMLPYATFLNTGRGAQVAESELIDTLTARPDLMAILDVTFPEPPVEGSPFYTLPNVFLTPHIAGSAGDEVARMGEQMMAAFATWRQDETAMLDCEVTLKMLETMA